MTFSSFQPPPRTLMGPGPSDIHPRVLAALGRPVIGHLDPEFIRMMDQVKELLKSAFHTKNETTLPISAPGSAGMEFCFSNLVEVGDKVIVCRNGVFGERMRENVERAGGTAVMVDDEWGAPVDPHKLRKTLQANTDAKLVAFVHAETSTGVESNAKELAAVAREHDCLTIVDTVTSLGGIPLLVDDWGLDAVYSGSQKCLSCIPGLSPVTLNEKALLKARERKAKAHSWFLDVNLLTGYWGGEGKRSYHHTAPVNPLYALHESLVLLHEEGLQNSWARHRRMHEKLRAGLEAMGLEFTVAPEHRLPQLNSVAVPAGVDEGKVRAVLLNDYSLEIGAGLGALAGKVWRIGLMGHACSEKNVLICLSALESVLGEMGAHIRKGEALAAARAAGTN